MKRLVLIGCLMALTGHSIYAQAAAGDAEARLWKSTLPAIDSISLMHSFKAGKFRGNARYFLMATGNSSNYSDYYANGLSLALKYSSASYHGFSFAVSGSAVQNLWSSNLAKPDEASNQTSRYEIGLFDILNPSNKNLLLRLEEMNARYRFKQSVIIVGNQIINTPFINLQDGRFRPTEAQGIYFTSTVHSLNFEVAYLNKVTPRSILGWYPVDRSIGLYAQGVNPDGSKSNYRDNLSSSGIVYSSLHYQLKAGLNLHLWNQLVANIFNSVMVQSDYTIKSDHRSRLTASLQLIRQDAVRNGGNIEPSKTYFPRGTHSLSFGGRVAWDVSRFKATFNFNRITAAGRYLMPREWGRDPFFTFLPRERNDGLGNVTAFMTQLSYRFKNLEPSIATGYYHLPDVRNFAMNKYGLPSYLQVNANFKYNFTGFAQGLDAELLFVYKGKQGNSYGIPGYEINKVDMVQGNLILNYYF